MTSAAIYAKDLAILVPDNNTKYALRGILSRPKALGIRSVTYEILTHIERDPGCLIRGHDFLRPLAARFRYAMIIFDRLGTGQERMPAEEMEKFVIERLNRSGWEGRASAIVLDPELEVWVWSDSPHVCECLGWDKSYELLRHWLHDQGLWADGEAKPHRPKEAMELVLRSNATPRSSIIYEDIASKVSFRRCADRSFSRLRSVLQRWFGEGQE